MRSDSGVKIFHNLQYIAFEFLPWHQEWLEQDEVPYAAPPARSQKPQHSRHPLSLSNLDIYPQPTLKMVFTGVPSKGCAPCRAKKTKVGHRHLPF